MDDKKEIQRAENLYCEGKFDEAISLFNTVIKYNPESHVAYNNMGVIYYEKGDIDRAEGFFKKAISIKEDYSDALLNISDHYQNKKDFASAAEHLEKLSSIYNRDIHLYNRIGSLYLEAGNNAKARETLIKSLEINPNQDLVKESLKRLENIETDIIPERGLQGLNLLFLELPGTSTGGFLDHIVNHFKKHCNVKYVLTNNEKEIAEFVEWADTVWLEWGNQMAIHVTNKVPQVKDKKVICRIHGYEVFTDMPAHIKWDVVDHLIFVAKHKQDIFNQKFKVKSPPQSVIRNGVNIKKFSIAPNKRNTKHLVLIGHLNFRKGLPILIQFYNELLKKDPEFHLSIRGEFQDPRLEMASHNMIKELGLENKIQFVGWVKDLNRWLADKSHILSFSLEESFHYAIGDGMAAGLKPVIHAWKESREIWPNEFIFKDFPEFVQLVTEDSFLPEAYRHWIESNFSGASQVNEIKTLLADLAPNDGVTHKDIRTYYDHRYGEKQERTMRPENAYHVFLDRLKVQKGKHLLDVACGTGYLLKAARQRGLKAYGIDISFEANRVTKRVLGKGSGSLNALGEALPFKEKCFDYLCCIGSLEHFLDMHRGLQEFGRVLKDEGQACIVLPNENFIGWKDKNRKGTAQQDINENLDTLDGWETLLNANGFEVMKVFQDNAISPNLQVADDLCYQFIFICRKKIQALPIRHKPVHILMTGGYGFGNLGDEAILSSYLRMFDAFPDLNFRCRIVSGNTMESSFLHPNIEKAIPWNWKRIDRELLKSDILLFGGGGVFFDFNNHKLKNLEQRCLLAQRACDLGKKLIFLGIGVNNLSIRKNETMLRETIERSALITVRDDDSMRCLKEMGVRKDIHLTADPVFSLYRGKRDGPDARESTTIGLCMRPTNRLLQLKPEADTHLAEKVAKFLKDLLENTSYSIEFISCKPGYDDAYAKDLINLVGSGSRCRVVSTVHWNEVIERQKGYRAFIGMSLHSLIFAFINHIPIIGLSYSTKVDGLFNRIKRPQCCIGLEGDVASRLQSAWEAIENSGIDFRFAYTNRQLKEKALENIVLLREALGYSLSHQEDVKMQDKRENAASIGQTNDNRWSDPSNLYHDSWIQRAKLISKYLPDKVSILDLGCGAMHLKKFLSPNSKYTGSDLVDRDGSTIVCDYNKGEMPSTEGQYDYVTLAGVLEYIHEPQKFLNALRQYNASIILTYSTADGMPINYRRSLGWVNDLLLSGLLAAVESAGLDIITMNEMSKNKVLLVASPRNTLP